uniref:Uncharacterized protein n=1 Tax=Acanthochromis polyacanthus TaxID=80966 RepID=A0A3Q1H700_9TELE
MNFVDIFDCVSLPVIQLLQGEESLLNLMMENSMQSTWKTPQLGRKPRGSNKDPPPQPPISKMDSCHISEDRGPWDSIHTGNGVASGAACGFTASSSPPPASSPGVTVPDTGAILRGGAPRLRLSRQGKSRGRGVGGGVTGLESMDLQHAGKDMSLLDAAETDGYFSDGEQSDSDTRSGRRKLRLPQLHSGNEDLLRRSVLAS